MPKYLSLINFTDQGARTAGDSIQRASSFGKAVEAADGKLLAQYWAIGEYDGCVVFEVPDEQTAAGLLVSLARDGNVRTQSMRLYDTREFEEVLAKT